MGIREKGKKKFFVTVLVLSMLLSSMPAYGSSKTEGSPAKADVPQIFIVSDEQIGKEEYVEAQITIVDSKSGSSETIIDKEAKIKIRGNSTANLSKLPFNIKLSEKESVLGMPEGKKWSLLANYLDTSLMRNKLAYDFAKEVGVDYSCDTRYADVWINGTYNGNYLVAVPVEVGANRVDINTSKNEFLLEINKARVEEDVTYLNTKVYRFEVNEPEEITEAQKAWLEDFLRKTEDAILSGDMTKIKTYIDVDSFVNFYVVQEVFKNMDANSSSTRFYIKNNKMYAGPLWDADLSAGNVSTYQSYENYLIYNNCGQHGNQSGNSYEGFWLVQPETDKTVVAVGKSWIGNLMKNDEFKALVYSKFAALQNQIQNLYQDNSLGKNKIDILLSSCGSSFSKDNAKWPVSKARGSELYRPEEKSYDASITFLRNFLKNRSAWLLNNLEKPVNANIPSSTSSTETNNSIAKKDAIPTASVVLVNNKAVEFEAYNIDGSNYFKLRDIAASVCDSEKKFEVSWDADKNAINLISNKSYTNVGGELAKGKKENKKGIQSTSKIYKDSQPAALDAYNIDGNNFFKLRDLAKIMDIGVTWDETTKTIGIDTRISYKD